MRRTRHVVLPVRSWQYIGLLIVSLACLTLGLVSRDREGHAGNLAGPELAHQAPHEVDACPNLNAITEMPSCPIAEKPEETKSVEDRKIETPMLSRSLSLDRSSGIGSPEMRQRSRIREDRTAVRERLSATTRIRVSDDVSRRESRFERLSRSRDLSNRATARRSADLQRSLRNSRSVDRTNSRVEDRRSRSTERRQLNEIAHRQDHRRVVDRSMDSRNSRGSVDRDRRSLSMERRVVPSEISGQESRRVSREYRDLARDRSARLARGDIDRNNNLDRRNRERSVEGAIRTRVANRARESPIASRDSRSSLERQRSSNDFSRDTLGRQIRTATSNDRGSSSERSSLQFRSGERREARERQQDETRRFRNRRSLDRATSRVLPANYREKLGRPNQRGRDSQRGDEARENSRAAATRAQRYDLNEIAASRQRGERLARIDWLDGRDSGRSRNSRDRERKLRDSSTAARRDFSLERRETRTSRLRRSGEERRIVATQQRSRRETERLSARISEGRSSERRVSADLARLESPRLSERRINDDGSKLRGRSEMANGRFERSPDLRVSRERISERQSDRWQRSSERRIKIDGSRLARERSRLADQRGRELQVFRGISERRVNAENAESRERSRIQNRARANSELRNAVRMMEHRASSRVHSENRIRSSERRSSARPDPREVGSQKERGVARSALEIPTRELVQQQREKSVNLNTVKQPSRFISAHRVIRVSRIPNQIRKQARFSDEETFSRNTDNNRLTTKWERNLQNSRIDRNEEMWTKTIPESLKNYEFLKYPMNYDLIKQAFIVALCTVYGFSLYNGKKSSISNNVIQRIQRFIIW